MPIWTEDRNLPGSAASSSAAAGPLRPERAIASSRALRDETIASSLIANTPFNATSARMMRTSIQGKGGSGAIGVGLSLPHKSGGDNRLNARRAGKVRRARKRAAQPGFRSQAEQPASDLSYST